MYCLKLNKCKHILTQSKQKGSFQLPDRRNNSILRNVTFHVKMVTELNSGMNLFLHTLPIKNTRITLRYARSETGSPQLFTHTAKPLLETLQSPRIK